VNSSYVSSWCPPASPPAHLLADVENAPAILGFTTCRSGADRGRKRAVRTAARNMLVEDISKHCVWSGEMVCGRDNGC
jgi:hypothetical protein